MANVFVRHFFGFKVTSKEKPIAQIEQCFVSRDTFHDIHKYFFVKRES